MAARVEDVRAMAALHARNVCSSPDHWMSYLNAAARFYRYPFSDSFLIHAQKPTAKAVATYDEWNKYMGRGVKKGSVGIALFNDTGERIRLKYVFDIKDTYRGKDFKRIYLWQIERKHEPAIRDHLRQEYGLTMHDGSSVPRILMSLSKRLTSENIRQAMYDLNKYKDNTYLAVFDEVALLRYFSDLVEQSLTYVLMERCGYHPMEHMDEDSFGNIGLFDDINVLPYLGEAVHTIAEPVLLDIGRVVRDIDISEHQKEMEQAPVPGQIQFAMDGCNVRFEVSEGSDAVEPEGENRDEGKGYCDRVHDAEAGGGFLPPGSDSRGAATGEHEGDGTFGRDKRPEKKKSDCISEICTDGSKTTGAIPAVTAEIVQEAAERGDKEKPRLKDRLAYKKREAQIINSGLCEVNTKVKGEIR